MIRRIVVVVPAADEEQRLGACLASIRAARDHLYRRHDRIQVQLVVVADGCRDGTAAVAAAGGARVVAIGARNVGVARRAGAAAALAGAERPAETWLASTDADSLVPVAWLSHMAAEARHGAHLVLGTALPGPGLPAGARAEWLRRHHLRDGHPHVHAANLGIRGDVYLSLGGWPPLVTGEDVALARRAGASGHLRISRTAVIPVVTSARLGGRAPHGFSGYLRALPANPLPASPLPASPLPASPLPARPLTASAGARP